MDRHRAGLIGTVVERATIGYSIIVRSSFVCWFCRREMLLGPEGAAIYTLIRNTERQRDLRSCVIIASIKFRRR